MLIMKKKTLSMTSNDVPQEQSGRQLLERLAFTKEGPSKKALRSSHHHRRLDLSIHPIQTD